MPKKKISYDPAGNYMVKVNNRNTSVSIVDFEEVIAGWGWSTSESLFRTLPCFVVVMKSVFSNFFNKSVEDYPVRKGPLRNNLRVISFPATCPFVYTFAIWLHLRYHDLYTNQFLCTEKSRCIKLFFSFFPFFLKKL